MTQGDSFRDQGIKKVEVNANQEWFDLALGFLKTECMITFYPTTDDVWWWLELIGKHKTHDNRAMGAVMRKAQAEGWIEPTDRVIKSTRPVCHSRPIRVWKSKLI